ncbi:MAG: ABC transporter ATP-binding protein [Kiritimatiellales bacterium]|nr:ABC transporter ATP-binding protein [Kiritimatiellales bacterium]
MTLNISILARNLTKDFILQEEGTILAKVVGAVKGSSMPRKIRALDNVSLTLRQGEVLGIIGRNGSGKTTLLRLLAGIYPPTSGDVCTHGNLVPLISTAVGAEPKLTMRDNIYLIGSLLGLSREAISEKFDSIVAFSELEDFVDVHWYKFSSGMTARLAFAIAAHLEPEILLLDEVFATGDLQFRNKSRNRMAELVSSEATVVMTGHSSEFMQEFADKVLWIDKGKVQMYGASAEVLMAYEEYSSKAFSIAVKHNVPIHPSVHIRGVWHGKPLTVFVHVPKTGGLTIREHVVNSLPKDTVWSYYRTSESDPKAQEKFAALSWKDCKKVQVLFSHDLRSELVAKCFPERALRYVTFLRDPAERLISKYNYHRSEYDRTGQPGIYTNLFRSDGSVRLFREWLDTETNPNHILSPVGFFLRWFYISVPAKGGITAQHFESLKAILRQFSFVGITEQSEDYDILYSLLGIKQGHPYKINVTPRSYITLEESGFRTMDELKTYARSVLPYDWELYEYAKELNKIIKQKEQFLHCQKDVSNAGVASSVHIKSVQPVS